MSEHHTGTHAYISPVPPSPMNPREDSDKADNAKSCCSDGALRSLLYAIKTSTHSSIIASFHKLESLCSSVPTEGGDGLGSIIRLTAIATSLVRHARQLHSTKALAVSPDVLGPLLLRSLRKLCDLRMPQQAPADTPSPPTYKLLRLLAAEVSMAEAQFKDRAVASVLRLTQGRNWDLQQLVQAMHAMPPPVDFSNPQRYVEHVEEDRVNDCMSAVEDISPTSHVSTQDPLTLKRIAVPVRGVLCRHLQCFDLLSFVMVLQRAAQTVVDGDKGDSTTNTSTAAAASCPVCSTKLRIVDLYIDRLQGAAMTAHASAKSLTIDRRSGCITPGTDLWVETEASPHTEATGEGARRSTDGSAGASGKRLRDSFTVEGMVVPMDGHR